MSYINYTIRSNGSRISNRHLFGKTVSFVMREVMWRRGGIRLAAGKCSLGRQVLLSIRTLSRLFTWELKSQTAVWDVEMQQSACFLRAGEERQVTEKLETISHHRETLNNEPRSFQAKPQQNTHIYLVNGIWKLIHLLGMGIMRNWSILVQFLISLNDSLTVLLMIHLVTFSKKENNYNFIHYHQKTVVKKKKLIAF